jgi:hypothetical protein
MSFSILAKYLRKYTLYIPVSCYVDAKEKGWIHIGETEKWGELGWVEAPGYKQHTEILIMRELRAPDIWNGLPYCYCEEFGPPVVTTARESSGGTGVTNAAVLSR